MLRAGVSLPALMKLLGHRTANMTLRYVEITQKDLQREFHLARQAPRHLLPLPAAMAAPDPDAANAAAVLERFSAAIRLLDLYRQQDPPVSQKPLQLLLRRLVRIRSHFQKLIPEDKTKNRLGLAGYVSRGGRQAVIPPAGPPMLPTNGQLQGQARRPVSRALC
jgi:hypothetical protein